MEKQFFSIGSHIFNKNHIIAIVEQPAKSENEAKTALIYTNPPNPADSILITLPEGKGVADFVDLNDLNFRIH